MDTDSVDILLKRLDNLLWAYDSKIYNSRKRLMYDSYNKLLKIIHYFEEYSDIEVGEYSNNQYEINEYVSFFNKIKHSMPTIASNFSRSIDDIKIHNESIVLFLDKYYLMSKKKLIDDNTKIKYLMVTSLSLANYEYDIKKSLRKIEEQIEYIERIYKKLTLLIGFCKNGVTGFIPNPGFYWYAPEQTVIRVRHKEKNNKCEIHMAMKTGKNSVEYVELPDSFARKMVNLKRMDKSDVLDFAVKNRYCAVCGRNISTEESVERGVGPICFNNLDKISSKVFRRVNPTGLTERLKNDVPIEKIGTLKFVTKGD